MSWQAAPGPVVRYRLSYVPLSGAGEILEAQTIGTETSIVLQELFPITTYRVSVFAEYASGMGAEMQIDGTTKEGEPESLFQNNGQADPNRHLIPSLCDFQSSVLLGTFACSMRPFPR